MTEISIDRLTGKTEITSSSDEAIAENLKNIQRDFRGLPNPEVILDGDSLAPYTGSVVDFDDHEVNGIDTNDKIVKIADLNHNDSRLGKLIRENLLEKKTA